MIESVQQILENVKEIKSEQETLKLISHFVKSIHEIKMNLSKNIEEISKYKNISSEVSIYENEKQYQLMLMKLNYLNEKLKF
jgi:hypothetical protein